MTEAALAELRECSEMFDFDGFMPEEARALIAEVDRLQAALRQMNTAVAASANETARRRAALRQYGRHLPTCEGSPGLGCTCGLNGALEGGK